MKVQLKISSISDYGEELKGSVYTMEGYYLTDSFNKIYAVCYLDQRNNIYFKGESSSRVMNSEDIFHYVKDEVRAGKHVELVGNAFKLEDDKLFIRVELILCDPDEALRAIEESKTIYPL